MKIYYFIPIYDIYTHIHVDSPVSPNPSVTLYQANTATFFKLQFSPPFLWPGHRIKSYNITITNVNSNEVIYDAIINATFGDAVVVYTQVLDPGVSCAKLMFLISALSRHDDNLEPFNTTIDHPGSKLPYCPTTKDHLYKGT